MIELGLNLTEGHASIEVPFESPEAAEMIRSALKPETTSAPSDRATASISVYESTLRIEISAGDLTALRAAMNSYISWISACSRTIDSVTQQNP